jgi:uncharacterized protein YndB with AHSA1/START domain
MTVDTLQLTHAPTVKVGMLIRKPPAEVFQAFVDPEITTRFWFSKSSGKVTPGAELQWEWEMYGVSTNVRVKEVDDDRRIQFEWDDEKPTTVEFRFFPAGDGATYLQVAESGFSGGGDEIVAKAVDSTGGFTNVVCAAKALLEHDVVLTVVLDHAPPKGLEL